MRIRLNKNAETAPTRASVCFTGGGSQVAVSGSGAVQDGADASVMRVYMLEDIEAMREREGETGSDAPLLPLLCARPRRSDDGSVLSMHCQDDHVVFGLQSAEALLYDALLLDFEKTLVRVTTPIHAVRFRPRPNKLLRPVQEVAVAGEDADIRIINVQDIKNTQVIKGHSDAIKSLAFSSDGDYLASVDTSGDLHIWDLRGSKALSLRVLRMALPATSTDLKDMGRVSWHPSGKFLAIPGVHKEINVLDTKTWKSAYTLKGHSKLLTAVQYSHDGSMLACSDQSGKVFFWEANQHETQPFKTVKSTAVVTDLCWHPSKNDLCLVTETMELDYFFNVETSNKTRNAAADTSVKANDLNSMFQDADPIQNDSMRSNTFKKKLAHLEAAAMEEDEFPFDDDLDDNFVVDDDGNGYAEDIQTRADARRYYNKQTSSSRAMTISGAGGLADLGSIGVTQTDIQESFQPGSTPFRGTKRYLAYNLLGTIYCVDQSSQSVMHISHHDKSQRDFSFQDHYRFTMAALNSHGAVFASDPNSNIHELGGNASVAPSNSVIEFKAFENWGAPGENNGWSVHLPTSETVKAICLSGHGVIVATSARQLRFISFSGVQTDVLSLSGNVVAMTGDGDFVGIVYHLGGTVHGDQNMGYMLLNVAKGISTLRKDALPLSPLSTLQWIGFSESGFLSSYDSCSVLRIMTPHDDFAWRPVFDGRVACEGKQFYYWPIGLTDTQLMCIICKSGDKFPAPPKSVISDMDLKMPLLPVDGVMNDDEDSLIRAKVVAMHTIGKIHSSGDSAVKERDVKMKLLGEIDKKILKQIMAACKIQKTEKALELSGTLNSVKSVDAALKVAVAFSLTGLANKINQKKQLLMKPDDEMMKRQARVAYSSQQHPSAAAPKTGANRATPATPEPPKKYSSVEREGIAEPTRHIEEASGAATEYAMQDDGNPYHDDGMDELDGRRASHGPPPSTDKKRSGRGLFGLGRMESSATKPKIEEHSPSYSNGVAIEKVKNPFAVSNVPAKAAMPAVSMTSATSVATSKASASVGSILQDLKDVKQKESKASKEAKLTKEAKEEQAKKRKQESITGFFTKKPKSDDADVERATEEEPSGAQPNDEMPASADDMDLDAALNALSDGPSSVEKENESYPNRSWEEKGKQPMSSGAVI
ncbi:hypothetical protein HDU80_010224 [Chytriomyces hyalinus]|nr:hypothetical protein HDU80_010224 [Chytriomyces hyalinus]